MVPYTYAFRHTPTIIERLLDQIPVGRFSESLSPDRFTLVEVVAHLADWEEIWLDRLVVAVEHPGSTFELYDEGQRAIDKKYAQKDIRHELAVFASRRRDTITFLEELAAEKWASPAVHPEAGPMTVKDFTQLISGHDIYHVEQISAYVTELHELIP
ncbi:MAG: DinB family protein [Fimbriimonas sp.]